MTKMTKSCFYAALLALLTLTTTQARAGTPVDQSFSCGPGNFLIGFVGHTGDWVDQLQPVCAVWDTVHQRIGAERPADNFGNVNGGSRVPTRGVCDTGNGFAVQHLQSDIVYPNGPPGHVRNVEVGCGSLTNTLVGSPQFIGDSTIHLGQGGYGWAHNTCPVGQLAYGVVISLDGVNITRLFALCDTVANIKAGAPTFPERSRFRRIRRTF